MGFGEILSGALCCFWLIYGWVRSVLQAKKTGDKKPQSLLWAICGCVCTVLLILAAVTQSAPMTLAFYIAMIISVVLILVTEWIVRK